MTPGLYGKLPLHGDFVARGWDETTVTAIDGWLADGLGGVRESDEAEFVERMRAAPLRHGLVAPGLLGDHALYLAIAPSVDAAGRLFVIAAGVAGPQNRIEAQAGGAFAAALDAALYDAVAGRLDADALFARLVDAATPRAPTFSDGLAWWDDLPDGRPAITAAAPDRAVLRQMMGAA